DRAMLSTEIVETGNNGVVGKLADGMKGHDGPPRYPRDQAVRGLELAKRSTLASRTPTRKPWKSEVRGRPSGRATGRMAGLPATSRPPEGADRPQVSDHPRPRIGREPRATSRSPTRRNTTSWPTDQAPANQAPANQAPANQAPANQAP